MLKEINRKGAVKLDRSPQALDALYDVCIIGAGVTGASLAYKLSQYDLKILWLEKENDVSLGATRANSAIIHSGYDPPEGSQMARLNVLGNAQYPELCETLDCYYDQPGSLVLAFDDNDMRQIRNLLERGQANGVPGLRILDRDESLAMEPAVNPDVLGSLYAPTAGIILPWDFCLGLAEVAVREGVELKLSTKVIDVERAAESAWIIQTNQGAFRSRFVLNAAGQGAEALHNLVAEPSFKLVPMRGEYYLLDATAEPHVSRVLFQCPNVLGKGVLVTPTVHGNTLVGPNAEVVDDGEDTSTTALGLAQVARHARRSILNLRLGANIRSFSGVRANQLIDDFHLEWAAPGFYDLAAIKSPGLTAAPAIADKVIEDLAEVGLPLEVRADWNPRRKQLRFNKLSLEEQYELIQKDPSYGRVICRCQTITEGEILACFRSPIPPPSIDGVKRRTGAGLGRCQGGFCAPRVLELLRDAFGWEPEDVLQDRAGSNVVLGTNRPEEGDAE